MRVPAPLKSMVDQVIRSASSVPANLAEGHGRAGGDRQHLWRIAYGSAKEVDSHLRLLAHAGVVDKCCCNRAVDLRRGPRHDLASSQPGEPLIAGAERCHLPLALSTATVNCRCLRPLPLPQILPRSPIAAVPPRASRVGGKSEIRNPKSEIRNRQRASARDLVPGSGRESGSGLDRAWTNRSTHERTLL